MKEFRIVPHDYGQWIVERCYKLFFGLIRWWDIAFLDRVSFPSIKDATKEILCRYPEEFLVVYKGRSKVLHYKRDK